MVRAMTRRDTAAGAARDTHFGVQSVPEDAKQHRVDPVFVKVARR